MTRLLGVACLTVAGFAAGMARCRTSRRHCRSVECWMGMLQRIRFELSLYRAPLEELAAVFSEGNAVFAAVGQLLREGHPFREAWNTALHADPNVFSELGNLLLPLGTILGGYLLEDQLRAIDAVTGQLQTLLLEEKTHDQQNRALAMRLFPAAGALLGILLL